MTSRPEFFHAEGRQTDGQTSMKELMFAFRNFCQGATNCSPLHSVHECPVHTGRRELTPDVLLL